MEQHKCSWNVHYAFAAVETLRSFDWSHCVRSIRCLHPTKLDTSATLTQTASGSEEEESKK